MNFMYSTEGETILVDDEQYEKMLDNKLWFTSPCAAAAAKALSKKPKKSLEVSEKLTEK